MKKICGFQAIWQTILIAGLAFLNTSIWADNANTGMKPDSFPPPFQTKSATNYSKVIGWAEVETPKAPAGFTVTKFADKLEHPRWIYVAENGDVFVAESNTLLSGFQKLGPIFYPSVRSQHYGNSANRITLFRDANQDGVPEERFIFAENLNQPFGMLILGGYFYVGNTDGIMRFDYKVGDTKLAGKGKMILPLPANAPNRHWTRNIIANQAGDKLYIGVGSSTNVAENGIEHETRRANILEINPDGSGERIYAGGLRNPVGMAWAPGTSVLWTAVNERDELGDELVPDYLTSVKEGGFYGWPFVYWGQHPDPRMKGVPQPETVARTIVPDLSLGCHTASLGLVFYTKQAFPSKYWNGAFITQHGSWNRKELAGYKVVFIPFQGGRPAGPAEDFLTGFMAGKDSEVHGRPVGLALLADGSLLVSDDASNVIWRISANK
jgi:glucose/arabinose dehydrogenase